MALGFFGLLALISAVWVIYDVLTQNKQVSKNKRIMWIVCAVLFSILTAIAYYFIEKK